MRRLAHLLFMVAAAGTLAGAPAPAPIEAAGEALGTTWRVRVARPPSALGAERLASLVRTELARVDARMSTWRDDTELVHFNRALTTDWFAVSAETALVAGEALAVADLSGGALDPTVGPLVALWGFGPAPERRIPPPAERLAEARARVGYRRLHVRLAPPALRKDVPDLALDLSAVAKGYAVDAIAARLGENGARAYLVEVGGELRARGFAPRGDPWQVGIERPGGGTRPVEAVVALRDEAIATSGEYREFVVRDGRRYGHVLDPRSGAPVRSTLASVSVIAPTAALADALATALFVLGPGAGCALAEREALAVLFLVDVGGAYEQRSTAAFEAHRVVPGLGVGGNGCSS